MRDILILILLVGGCLWAIREPWIGAIGWTIVSLGSPHFMGYAAAGWPVSMAVAGATFTGIALNRQLSNPFGNAAVVMTLALAIWMSIALPFSLEPDYCFNSWDRSMKIYVMLFVTVALLDTRKKLDVFIWANVASIGYYGVKGGIFSILTGGHFIILGPGGFIGGNNELALAEIVVLPFLRYLQLQSSDKWVRRAIGASMFLLAVSVLVSRSRGGLLGLAAMVAYFWWKNDNKLRWGLMIIVVSPLVLGAMPEEWWSRMDTIKSYEEDTSAQGRINSWWLAWNIANDRITGGGFTITVPWIFAKYAPNPRIIFAAHSIYFQMLGEQGFIGLGIFLLIGVLGWINASRLIRRGKKDPADRWAAELGSMIHVSMLGYAVTGVFLSLALYDLPYNVMAMSAVALRLLAHREQASPAMGPAAPAGGEAPRPTRLVHETKQLPR